MNSRSSPKVVILNIDGLRSDVLRDALARNTVPRLASIVGPENGGASLHLPAISGTPSVTFACQATIATGAPSKVHRIVGNQFFDRAGLLGRTRPRFYAFDVGERGRYGDALAAFRPPIGLADRLIPSEVPTMYESAARAGLRSVVANCMIARGASRWLRPGTLELARLTKGGTLFGLRPEQFDRRMVKRLATHFARHGVPDITMAYFMGIDHTSHHDGPGAQSRYLERSMDPIVGELIEAVGAHHPRSDTLFVVLSDHGSFPIRSQQQFQLLLRRPTSALSGALPHGNRIVGAANGGLAYLYVRRHGASWATPPSFEHEVLPLAELIREASATGSVAPELKHAIRSILVRNCERDGPEAPFLVFNPNGSCSPIEELARGKNSWAELVHPHHRFEQLRSPFAGDLVVLPATERGYHFGGRGLGMHGSLERADSECVLALGRPDLDPQTVESTKNTWERVITRLLDERDHTYISLEVVAPLVLDSLGVRELSPR